jgi:hypothetical protein
VHWDAHLVRVYARDTLVIVHARVPTASTRRCRVSDRPRPRTRQQAFITQLLFRYKHLERLTLNAVPAQASLPLISDDPSIRPLTAYTLEQLS